MSALEDLEYLYSPSRWSKRYSATEVVERHIHYLEEHSKLVKENIPCELGVPYGPGQREKYDIYGTDLKDDSPILIHIHGGYYQEELITHSNNGFIANALHPNGIKTVLLGYELGPQRTVPEILEHVQIGLRECIKYARKLKSRGVYLSGHSVGAHAIATILTDFKRSIPKEDGDLIKGAVLMCGVYNFEPVTKMSANEQLSLSVETAKEELSPLFENINYGDTAIYVVAAANDSPAFVHQSKEFYDKLRDDEVDCQFNILPEVDHFDIVEKLYNADYDLTKILVDLINNGS